MTLLSPTKLQQRKLKEMIQQLFPQYNYVKFCSMGIIFLSKSFWYSFIKMDTVHVTELCTVLIPERLNELQSRTFDRGANASHQGVYNKYSHTVLDLLHLRGNTVIDYLYDEYILLKYGIQKDYYVINQVLPKKTYSLSKVLLNVIKNDGIVLSQFSNVYIKQALKQWKNSAFVLNHPKLRSNFLDMWFKKEVKERIRQIYNVRITFA